MDYEEWLDQEYDNLCCECAESGADRELDFDFDKFCEDRFFEEIVEKDAVKIDDRQELKISK